MPLEPVFVHGNDVRLFGLSNTERVKRMVAALPEDIRKAADRIEINLDYAFDPVWLNHIAAKPGRSLNDGDVPVIAHHGPGVEKAECYDLRQQPKLYNETLRKLQQPFSMPLTAENRGRIERDSYYGAYKGVTDLLTKYLWPQIAFYLTKAAAKLHISPNMVTAIGAVCCVLATLLFAEGHYWWGIVAAFSVHGARHRRRQTGAMHDDIKLVGQPLRPWHRFGASALLVLVLGDWALGLGARL